MSSIQCARHKDEQNMTVFQYNGNLYYRAFRDILPYTEILVWYDDRYSDSMDMEAISMAGPDTLKDSGNFHCQNVFISVRIICKQFR